MSKRKKTHDQKIAEQRKLREKMHKNLEKKKEMDRKMEEDYMINGKIQVLKDNVIGDQIACYVASNSRYKVVFFNYKNFIFWCREGGEYYDNSHFKIISLPLDEKSDVVIDQHGIHQSIPWERFKKYFVGIGIKKYENGELKSIGGVA